MATTLLRDVISYSSNRGSAVYTCLLDEEGAFDVIPHAILFDRASDVLPDHCEQIIIIQIKWSRILKGNAAYLIFFFIMDKNDALSEYNRISVGHKRTNGALYSEIYFAVEICSAH